MPDNNGKRIAKNALMLYARMLLTMLVSLYTSRVTLNVLGVTDFGIYNVVGGLVVMISFFQSSLANAAQRYLSLAIGQNDLIKTQKAFRQGLSILFVFAILVLIVGETIGLWFVNNKLVIPEDRLEAANWIYQFSLISVFFTLINVIAIADIISREKMSIYAYLGLFEAFAKLGVVYLLVVIGSDKLVLYGLLLLILIIVHFLIYAIYCTLHFPEARWKWLWDNSLVREMSKFIGYNLFGCFAYSGAEQGISIVLNLFFGPVVNAARGISSQIVNVVVRFTDSIMTAFKPQIIKSYASGDKEYMIMLIEKSSRFSFFLAVLISFPLIANIDFFLKLWLGQVPDYASSFTVLVLFETMIAMLINPLWIAANATGVIFNIQVFGRLITLSSLPLAYISLLFLDNPNIAILWLVITQFFYWIYCLYDINRQIHLKVRAYMAHVAWPCIIITVIVSTATVFTSDMFSPVSIMSVMASSCIVALIDIVTIYFALDEKEKKLLWEYANKLKMLHRNH